MTATAAGAVVLAARGVRLAYGAHRVLDDVDLDVRAGEVVALVGPNGAGKSTLLGVLAGEPRPDAGQVLLDGADLRDLPLTDLARQRAVMLQEVRVSFPFRVREVVAMGRHPWRGTPGEADDDAVVDRALVDADVVPLAGRTFPTLSGGERARAAFARVLAQDGRVLLLDEPTAALDVRHQEAVLARARTAARTGCAVVVVLHDLTLAAAYADRVVVLADGRVVADGPPHAVLTSALLTEVYGHPLEVVPRVGTDEVVILPVRRPRPVGDPAPSAHHGADQPADHPADHPAAAAARPCEVVP
ncbi:heme ABC transporter ATP-binding protein [Cellulomonas oligotrophica]|uniref:Hemin import ATP-binding protein HmuV n=1 Tax=Cellulomonas oligotrophica TaxID=931536 RepID=A0A7Y9K0S8_9CELL|nr:heme ABC transporter ATP-binding protein [Cellulomonas oligotrophica]NYD87605.1 iron complex transport system ATP-binding protein [Cellulomonas oligotrophica]GIG33482.1 hemin import ATP-binding protein HmuV [Cellulomonas oligotrophica]